MSDAQGAVKAPNSPQDVTEGVALGTEAPETAEGATAPYSEVVTPSGIEIRYFAKDKDKKVKRHYEVWQGSEPPGPATKIQALSHIAGWIEVPSVTTVLEVLDKPALPWWGMEVGVEGLLYLHRNGLVRSVKTQGGSLELATPGILPDGSTGLVVAGQEQVVSLLKTHKLTTNHVKSSAGDRGQSAHDALEVWCETGEMPNPEFWRPEERGYVVGLRMFLEDLQKGGIEPLDHEVIVASVEYGYAGRFDLRFKTTKSCPVSIRVTPKRGAQYVTLQPGVYLADLKTSKGVYAKSHFRQLAAYEGASVEDGYEPTDAQGIIHVHPGDPKDAKMPDSPFYEFVRSKAKLEHFLSALEVYHHDRALEGTEATARHSGTSNPEKDKE